MLSRGYLMSRLLGESPSGDTEAVWDFLALLAEWGTEVAAQSNHCTACPMFGVVQTRRVWGVQEDYASGHVWIDAESGDEVCDGDPDDSLFKALELLSEEAPYDEFTLAEQTYRKAFYREETCPVEGAVFLVRDHAERYIRQNRHNLADPSVYVHSAHRNVEWQRLRELVLLLAKMVASPSDVEKETSP